MNNIYKFNKNKELLSVSKANNNIKNKNIQRNTPKYSKCPHIQSYYSTPFDISKFTLQKRNYYVNPQKPPEEDPLLYIMIGVSYLTYRCMNNPPAPPTHI